MPRIFAAVFFLSLCACSRQAGDLNSAAESTLKGHYVIALSEYETAIKRNISSELAVRAAKEAAQVAHLQLKDYRRAVEFYRHVITYSKNSADRQQAQKSIAQIYFDNMQDYVQAVSEYNRLLTMTISDGERSHYKLTLARANYYLGSFDQAMSEVDAIIKMRIEESVLFSAYLLRANIFVGQKLFAKAADAYRELMKQFPDRSKKENVFISLAVCYEESGDFIKAQQTLEQYLDVYQPRDYLEIRISRLKERAKNQPGARGLRK